MHDIKFAYEKPKRITENLWEVRGDWKNKFGRRMTVVQLKDNRLMIHNAIRLQPSDLDWLRSLGLVAIIVAPNTFHCSDAGWMCERFSSAQLFVPNAKLETFRKLGLQPRDLSREFPDESEIKCFPMKGTRVEEAAFLHTPSRTLILCDLAFNMPEVFTGLTKYIMKWNQIGGQFGPSRLTKLVFTNDQKRLLDSYKNLLSQDFDRVIVNHGDVLERDGKRLLQKGVERIFGAF